MDRQGHVHFERKQGRDNSARVSATSVRSSFLDETGTWLPPVIDDHTQTPPLNPSRGDRYIIPCGATGEWSGRATQVAEWDGAKWVYSEPPTGANVWVQSRTYFTVLIDTTTINNSPLETAGADISFWFPHHYLDNAHTINPVSVVSSLNTPPVSPGPLYSAYLVGETPTDEWVGFENYIAFTVCSNEDSREWVFYEPLPGQLIWNQDTEAYYIYNTNNEWVLLSEYVAAELDLSDLADVSDSPASDGDVLTWDAGEGHWEPRSSVHTLGSDRHSNVNASADSAPVNKVLAVVGSSGQWAPSDVPPHTHQISDVVGLEDALDDAGGGGGAAENIQMLRGKIGLAFPTAGAGWSAVRLGLGNYQVTWTVTVPSDVTLLLTPGTSITGALFGYSFSPGGTPDSTGFIVAVYRWNGATWDLDDVGLSFLAVWGT